MSLFVRVVTHYGSNESNDSLGVYVYTHETIFESFYYLYYMAYVTEIDLFDAQYKDKWFIT